MADLTNYPDLLGSITKGIRANLGLVQVASALRPRVIMAGRPLEMLLLLQNASNAELMVQAVLKLPAQDANRQKSRFLSSAGTLSVRLAPSAVGLITLPLATLPDIAIGSGYKIGMEVRATANGKSARIRQTDGGDFDVNLLTAAKRDTVEALQKLPWTASLNGSALDNSLTVMSGKIGTFADLEPTFSTLWTPTDYADDVFLLHSIAPMLYGVVLPSLKRPAILPVMQEYTLKRFKDVGYALQAEELDGIARFLTLQLENAAHVADPKEVLLTTENPHSLHRYVTAEGTLRADTGVVTLPHWVKEFARVATQDGRVTQFPIKAIAHFAYDGLLRDAMLEAFVIAEQMTGVELGTRDEHEAYVTQVLEALQARQLTFDQVYLPLMLGVIAQSHSVTLRSERTSSLVGRLRTVLDSRYKEQTDETRAVYKMATTIMEEIANRYGTSQ